MYKLLFYINKYTCIHIYIHMFVLDLTDRRIYTPELETNVQIIIGWLTKVKQHKSPPLFSEMFWNILKTSKYTNTQHIRRLQRPRENWGNRGEPRHGQVPFGDYCDSVVRKRPGSGGCELTFCCHSSCHCKNSCCCCNSSSYEVSAELGFRFCDLCALGGPLYSWNLIVRVLACDLLLLFFRFLSLPGAGCCWSTPWCCTCSDCIDATGGGGGTGVCTGTADEEKAAYADTDEEDEEEDEDEDEDEGGAGGGEATELIGDRLDVDEPSGEGSNVNVTIPALAAAVSIMS